MSQPDKPKILIVDDTPENLHILVESMRGSCAVVVARDGAQALRMACQQPPPEVILLDVMMPGMDGFEVCRQLKRG